MIEGDRQLHNDTVWQPTPDIRLLMETASSDGQRAAVFAVSDVSSDGPFQQTWLGLVGNELVIADSNELTGARVIELGKQVEVVVAEGKGVSRFRVIRDGELVEELRFSRRQAKPFAELQRHCEAICEGKPEELISRDDDGKRRDERTCSTCERLIPDWADSCPRCLQKRKILWRLISYARPYRGLVIGGLASAIVMTMLGLVPPILTQTLIDDVLAPRDESKLWLLWALLGVLAGVTVGRVICIRIRLRTLAYMGEKITHDLRTQAYRHLQKLSLAYFNKKPTGQLISRVSHDTDRLWDFIAFGVIESIIATATIVGVAVVMVWKSPILAALTLIPLPLGVLLTYFHTRRMRRYFRRIWRKWSRMTAQLSGTIPGIRVVKAFTQEDRETSLFDQQSKDVHDEALALHDEWTGYWPKVTLLLQMGNLVIWAYAGPRILGGEFTLGTFVMFSALIWMFYQPIEELGMMNRVFQRAATSAQRVFEIIDTQPTVYTRRQPLALPKIDGRVTFEGVKMSYDGVKLVLNDINFDIEPGEMIGLAGPSGGGKTTLVNLIARFYDPVAGSVQIDGKNVRDLDLHELRSQVGIVLQEPYLFTGTVSENIAYGNPDAKFEDIVAAARAANAHDFVVGFSDGYDTMVGERGQTLSGGERQRISIARAILNNPRILIFDEATSSVDTETEKKIQEAIDRLVEGRTTFAIAHRLSTLRTADRLLVLEKGKLAQVGTHEELLADEEGLYARLNRTQSELHGMFAM